MKNEYRIDGDITTIFIKRRSGQIVETIIDTEDLEKITSIPVKWHSSPRHEYVRAVLPKKTGKEQLRLHRAIVDAPKGLVVDHINHNVLDNRKSNLRVITQGQNNQNKKGASTSSTTGHLCVFWNVNCRKWQVRIKNKHFGLFEDLHQAVEVANSARANMLPYSKETKLKTIEFELVNEMINKSARERSKKHLPTISWHSRYNHWQVRVTHNGKRKHLGCFKTKVEAEEFVKSI